MLNRLSQHLFERSITAAYTKRFKERGAQADGVFWASRLSQTARFDHLLSCITSRDRRRQISLADIGCGYGALADFIAVSDRYQHFSYLGYDINATMIAHCKAESKQKQDKFHIGRKPDHFVDYAAFVGTFNLCHTDDYDLWQDYILRQLSLSWKQVRTGMALNITSLETAIIKNQIFYVNPLAFKKQLEAVFGTVHISRTRYVDNDVTYLILK